MAISKSAKIALVVVAAIILIVAITIPVVILTSSGHSSQNSTTKPTPSTTASPRVTSPQRTVQPRTTRPTAKPTDSVGTCGSATAAVQFCTAVKDVDRHDCFPDEGVSESKCQQRGCCWRQPNNSSSYSKIPNCFFPANYTSYIVDQKVETSFGWRIKLQRCRLTPVMFAEPVDRLNVEIQFQQSNRLRVKVYKLLVKEYSSTVMDLNS